MSRLLLLSTAAALLAGCAVGPSYHAPRTETPTAFAGAASLPSASGNFDPEHWWQVLADPELDSLVERAIRANPDIEIALGRLQEAREQEAVLVGQLLPQVAASAAAGRGTGSDVTRAGASPALRAADNKGSLEQVRQIAGFAASWELDLFGGYRRAFEAGKYDAEAAAAARSAVLIGVIADVSRNYVDMRGLQARLVILQQNITIAEQSKDLAQTRFDRGLTNELDLQLAIRELGILQAEVPLLQSAIQSTQYDIAALLGRYPEDLVEELSAAGTLPNLPQGVAPGLPVDLLQRRPDVREAERLLAAATARIGVATSELYPHLAVTGALGTQSAGIGAHGSHIWGFGPAVYWPLLDFGALDAVVNIADFQAHERLVAYRKTVIAAVQDADNAIADYSAQAQRLGSLANAMVASERAVDLAQQRYDRGLTDFLNVIDAERARYALEEQYVAAQQSAADALVYLCRALGGGWEQFQNVPPIPMPEPAAIALFHRLASHKDPQQQ